MKCVYGNQSGFSLLEVLLTCALGSLILFGLMQLYLSCKFVFNMQEGVAKIQENGRVVVNLLNQRVHIAGYAGCEDPTNPVHADAAIHGYRSDDVPDYLSGAVVADTDVVIINACDWKDSENIYLEKAYYIGNSNRKNAMNQPIYSLFEKTPDGNRQELVANVESIKILYGPSDLTADQIQNWSVINSIKITLLLNSEDAVLKKPQTYIFNGKTLSADKKLRREWDMYIYLREIKS